MAGWKTYLIKPTNSARILLRLFALSHNDPAAWCSPGTPLVWHDASVAVDTIHHVDQYRSRHIDAGLDLTSAEDKAEDDIRAAYLHHAGWPTQCARCGAPASPTWNRQIMVEPLYDGFPDGRPRSLREAASPECVGAMYDAPWYRGAWEGPDGRCLHVVLPSGLSWFMDGPAKGEGKPWSRGSLDAGPITASPSINHPGHYHGWLQNGVLTPDCEGRAFPNLPYTA